MESKHAQQWCLSRTRVYLLDTFQQLVAFCELVQQFLAATHLQDTRRGFGSLHCLQSQKASVKLPLGHCNNLPTCTLAECLRAELHTQTQLLPRDDLQQGTVVTLRKQQMPESTTGMSHMYHQDQGNSHMKLGPSFRLSRMFESARQQLSWSLY